MNVAPRHPSLPQRRQEIGTAGAGFIDAIAELVHLAAARAANGIVPPYGVLDDRHQDLRNVRIELEPLGDVDRTVQLDRVGVVVADFSIKEVEGEEVDRLLPADVNDPEVSALRD